MRCLLFFVLCSLGLAATLHAQYAGVAAHTVYVEAGGFGGMYSVDYDRLLPQGVVLRVGATSGTMCGWVGDCRRTVAVPLGASYLWGNPLVAGNQWVEAGGGLVVGAKGSGYNNGESVETKPFVSVAAMVALRRQPAGRGVMFRLAVTPMLTVGEARGIPEGGAQLSAGIALGYAF